MKPYKILVVGSAKCGKTTFVRRHLDGTFLNKYESTLGVQVDPLRFDTNYGTVCFNMWDCAGDLRFIQPNNEHYLSAQGAIIMFDLLDDPFLSVKNVLEYKSSIKQIAPDCHIVVCGNKQDDKRCYQPKAIPFGDSKYWSISCRSCLSFIEPFLELARHFTGHPDLVFNEIKVSH